MMITANDIWIGMKIGQIEKDAKYISEKEMNEMTTKRELLKESNELVESAKNLTNLATSNTFKGFSQEYIDANYISKQKVKEAMYDLLPPQTYHEMKKRLGLDK